MEKSKYKNKQGSILIGVIIIFLMISSLSVAIISRSLQGTILTTDSKKGYIAYQNSDKNTENFLNSFKTLDNNGGGNKIPENSNVLNFCGSATCSNATEGTLSSTNTVADIFSFKAVGAQNQGATRAISAPVPERINGKLVASDLTVKNCDGTLATCNIGGRISYNKCDMSIKVPADTFDPLTIKNYEVRKSTSPLLAYGLTGNTLYGWQKVLGPVSGGYFAKNDSLVIQNGDTDSNIVTSTTTTQNGGQYGKTYYFTIKARNLKPFTLDSLYFADTSGNTATSKKVELDPYSNATSCPALYGPLANCLARGTNPAGTETATTPYNCCNGSECYQHIVGWSDEGNKNCALENIVHNLDDIQLNTENPRGDLNALTGYCGTRQNSQSGRDCQYPFRTQAYCKDPPPPSTQELGIVPTNWSLQNLRDVYMSTNKTKYRNPDDVPYPDGKPRCSRHDCLPTGSVVASPVTDYCRALPYHGNAWDATGTSCAQATCGDYSLSKSCVLSCKSPGRYSPYSGSITGGYSSGKDCTETCPSGPPFTSNDPQRTEGACSYALPNHGTSWTNNSSCQSNTRPATASQHGYTVTESCSLNCTNNYTPTNPTNTSSACCTQDCNTNTWSNPGCPANPSNGYYSNGYYCQSNTCGNVSTAGSCTMYCNYDYHITSSSCTFNHNYNVSCGSKDANSSWVNGSTYTQDWYWWYGQWSSASAHLGSGTCGYTCNSGFHSEDNSSCIPNTRSCGTAPTNYHWTNDNETWNGSWSGCTYVCNNPPISYPTAPSCTCGYSGGVTGNSCVGYSDSRSCYDDPPTCDPMTCPSGTLQGTCQPWCGGADNRTCTCPAKKTVVVTYAGTIAAACPACSPGKVLPASITCYSGSSTDFIPFGASCTAAYCSGCSCH